MPSRIENEFMIDEGFLALSGIELLKGEIRIHLRTWPPENRQSSLQFREAVLTSIEPLYDDKDSLEFPWDIIGFESTEIVDARWRFTLTSDVAEIGFESAWPVLMES